MSTRYVGCMSSYGTCLASRHYNKKLFRQLAQDLSHTLITMLQQECMRSTCPEMKAGEWVYLRVAHRNEGAMEVCALSRLRELRKLRFLPAMLCYRLYSAYAR